MKGLSLSTRLAGMFAAAALGIFLLIGSALYCVLDAQIERLQRSELDTRFNLVARMLDKPDLAQRWSYMQLKLNTLSQENGLIRFWIDSADPRFHYGEPAEPVRRLLGTGKGYAELMLPGHESPLSARVGLLPASGERPTLVLLTAIDSVAFQQARQATLITLFVLSALGIALATLCGHWIARVGLRPLHELSAEARQISPQQLSQRLRLEPLPAELSALAKSFNEALDRLEQAYLRLESFNADVAHELRTPLANLIGQSQVALSRERSAQDYEEVLQSNLEELERLRAIVNDMLFLARVDQGGMAAERVETSLASEVATTLDFLDVIFDERGVQVDLRGDARACVERALFQRAVTNLLYNAAQHTAPGGRIEVRLSDERGAAQVEVSNPGEPIGAEQRARVFERFYRADLARANSQSNHGLGLSIVKAVASMHGGSVLVRSEGGVNTFGFTVDAVGPVVGRTDDGGLAGEVVPV
ncbi:heavy metal sensor histidine kinase [Pseudomonas sp. PDNC002]|uniref:heavy metal sensor histidine kinase n=1 Tax=Pseudomonas sp. PDNC002 TaxID=2811422 RepID=UPI00196595F4|nr:heavy metal sensor histidine kinase [Pseudomonas sp. PDNC002]QRY78917.1 heavy metal sensor histidine kinase [Pseudomonas sp. PDNC002]